jgi:hypothetical protein
MSPFDGVRASSPPFGFSVGIINLGLLRGQKCTGYKNYDKKKHPLNLIHLRFSFNYIKSICILYKNRINKFQKNDRKREIYRISYRHIKNQPYQNICLLLDEQPLSSGTGKQFRKNVQFFQATEWPICHLV